MTVRHRCRRVWACDTGPRQHTATHLLAPSSTLGTSRTRRRRQRSPSLSSRRLRLSAFSLRTSSSSLSRFGAKPPLLMHGLSRSLDSISKCCPRSASHVHVGAYLSSTKAEAVAGLREITASNAELTFRRGVSSISHVLASLLLSDAFRSAHAVWLCRSGSNQQHGAVLSSGGLGARDASSLLPACTAVCAARACPVPFCSRYGPQLEPLSDAAQRLHE